MMTAMMVMVRQSWKNPGRNMSCSNLTPGFVVAVVMFKLCGNVRGCRIFEKMGCGEMEN